MRRAHGPIVDPEHMAMIKAVEDAGLGVITKFMVLLMLEFKMMELQRLALGEPSISSLTVDEIIEVVKGSATFVP